MPRPLFRNSPSQSAPQCVSTGIEPTTHQPTSQFHGTESFWRSWEFLSYSRNSPLLKEAEVSSPRSHLSLPPARLIQYTPSRLVAFYCFRPTYSYIFKMIAFLHVSIPKLSIHFPFLLYMPCTRKRQKRILVRNADGKTPIDKVLKPDCAKLPLQGLHWSLT